MYAITLLSQLMTDVHFCAKVYRHSKRWEERGGGKWQLTYTGCHVRYVYVLCTAIYVGIHLRTYSTASIPRNRRRKTYLRTQVFSQICFERKKYLKMFE